MKKIAVSALLVLLALVVGSMTAIGQTLTIVLWQIPAGSIIPDDVIEEFEAAHPGVTIDLIQGSSTAYEERLQVMIASGTAPDIFAIPDYSITVSVKQRPPSIGGAAMISC